LFTNHESAGAQSGAFSACQYNTLHFFTCF